MDKIIKRVMTMLGAGVMTLSLLAPVNEVSAASKNKVAEIPVNFKNMSGEELEKCDWKFGGNLELPSIDLHHGVVTHWDEEQQTAITPDYASVKKSGDFYVVTYDNTTSGVPQAEDAQTDVTKSENVGANFYLGIQGVDTTAKNCKDFCNSK